MDGSKILRQALSNQDAAAQIIEEYESAQRLKDDALLAASCAVKSALRCGDLLLEVKSRMRGEFLLWLENYCPQISVSTCYNYMKVSKLRRELGNASVDLQSLRQFYQLCGIMPPRSPAPRANNGQILQFWSFATKIGNWLPMLPDSQKPRIREWWETIGKGQGWI
jgi:hypothetical protein